MCNHIFQFHQLCHHPEYQNTSPCYMAKGCDKYDDEMLLKEPVFLFDTKKGGGPESYEQFDCKKLTAIRPTPTKCDDCRKQEQIAALKAKQATPVPKSDSSRSGKKKLGGYSAIRSVRRGLILSSSELDA